jgi:cell division protein FtsA
MKKQTSLSETVICSIDIGTTKISVLIGICDQHNNMTIVGIGRAPSEGLERGVVVNISKTVESIKLAVKEAELMAGIPVESAYIGISGSHIHAYNSQGVVPIKQGTITERDIHNVIGAAQAIPLVEGQQVLHVLPQYFIIDGQEMVTDPRGMHGIRLEAYVHIITGSVASVQNLINCCQSAGVKVQDIVLEHIASAHAVLTQDEQDLGVGVIDIGGGTSDFALYQKGSIRHTKVIPIAGNHFTNDCAIGLHVPKKEAERIKTQYGHVYEPHIIETDLIEIVTHHRLSEYITLHDVNAILQPRAEELCMMVHQEITTYKLQRYMPTGLVITGGGSLLDGLASLAHDILRIPVRIGKPHIEHTNITTLTNPQFATGYGLLLYAQKKSDTATMHAMNGPLMGRIMGRMKAWISDFF